MPGIGRSVAFVMLAVGWWNCLVVAAWGQASPIYEATAGQRLSLKQLRQLIDTGEADQAATLAMRIIDEAGGRLVARRQPGEPWLKYYVPIEAVVHLQLLSAAGGGAEQARVAFARRYDAAARSAWERLSTQPTAAELRELLRRYRSTSLGDALLLALADAHLRRGEAVGALGVLRQTDRQWRPNRPAESGGGSWVLDWPELLRQVAVDGTQPIEGPVLEALERVRDASALLPGTYAGGDVAAEVGLRMVYAYRLLGREADARRTAALVRAWHGEEKVVFLGQEATLTEQLERFFEAELRLEEATEVAGPPSLIPSWIRPSPPMPKVSRRLWPERLRRAIEPPAMAEPQIAGGLVFLNTGRRLYGRRLEDGMSWPPGSDSQPFYRILDEDLPLWSEVEPLEPWPTFRASVRWPWLAACMGRAVPVDGESERRYADSQLVVVNLAREGQLQSGYPRPAPRGTAYVSQPQMVGRRLLVAVAESDGAELMTRVQCLDLLSGLPIWRSPPVARQTFDVLRNRMPPVELAWQEDRVYVLAGRDLVMLDNRGRRQWAVRLQASELETSRFPRRRWAAEKPRGDLALAGQQLVLSAVDVDRVVQLDAVSGTLQWATAAGQVDDVWRWLGATETHWIGGGRRLVWLRRDDGRLAAAFPERAADQPGGGAAGPVGDGQGAWINQHVFWVTDKAGYCFAAELPQGELDSAPRMLQRRTWLPYPFGGGRVAFDSSGGAMLTPKFWIGWRVKD